MKQIAKTDSIRSRLRKALGGDANTDVENLSVYEATAFNTLPIRKNHPLFFGARAERSMLLEMAAALEAESLPMQIQHDTDPLPVGRVFHGEVLDRGGESELRVLFFLDASDEAKNASTKIDSGSVDQVSVSVLPKQIICSASGFDFLGEKSTFENRYTATDPDGNTLGKNGVYAKLVGLAKWSELSLVGRGGAQNARIIHRDKSYFGTSYDRLAADGIDPSILVLDTTATKQETEKKMDTEKLVAQLIEKGTEVNAKVAEIATLTASVSAKDTKIADLEAKLTALGDPAAALTAKDTQLTQANTDKDAAIAALKEVAQKVLTAAGKPTETPPNTVAELTAIINDTSAGLVAALAAGGKSKDTVTDASKENSNYSVGAFRSRK